ncbi:MAG: ribosome silencing factor [Planctomycetota bacterium]|nr:MAG: ribosome silencing factor [Planctomycetota bacterium]
MAGGRTPTRSAEEARRLALALAAAAREMKAEEVRVLEVADLLFITDYFVIATTGTPRQTRGLAESLNQTARELGFAKGRLEGDHRSHWLLLDFGVVVVHLLTPEAREFYALDDLWAEAREVETDESAA